MLAVAISVLCLVLFGCYVQLGRIATALEQPMKPPVDEEVKP